MVILIDKPLRRAISSPEAVGWMALWAIELSEFDIQYRPRTAIKRQVIADFIAEFTNIKGQGAKAQPQWSIHKDGSSNRRAGRVSIVLHSPKGDEIKFMIRLDFLTTNNEVKYEALIAGLDLAKATRAANVVVYYNS